METIGRITFQYPAIFGSYRTYEEWKPCWISTTTSGKISVLTVPMRNGNVLLAHVYSIIIKVLTVPMRNGNYVCWLLNRGVNLFLPYLWGMETLHFSPTFQTHQAGSYRTYEEWKLRKLFYGQRSCYVFLPYLWGMETKWTCGHAWTIWVLTVPMRNGNFIILPNPCLLLLVLTVPMRNGNYWHTT